MNRKHQSETGQALILIVLGIVGMLGFAALAIDGGRIYTDRRIMQNASDTASLTAAASFANYMSEHGIYHTNWTCLDDDTVAWYISAKAQAFSDAINRASSNGFSIDTDASDKNGVFSQCGQDVQVGFTEKYIDVTTYVTADTTSSFAQFVFGGPLRQTVISTARVYPQTSGGFGAAIVALNEAGCSGNSNGVQINGNDDIYVNGGGIFSNGCLGASGAHLVVDVDNGGTTYIGEYQPTGGPIVDPEPAQGGEPLPADTFSIPPPDCSGLSNQNWNNGDPTMSPGNYNSTSITAANSDVTMAPGLYCFDGSFTVNGGKLTGIGVTIYMIDGDFSVSGNVMVKLEAPLGTPSAVAPAIPNVVVFLAPGNTGEASMLGNTGSSYAGTVYAPDGHAEIGGTAGLNPTYSTQIIAWDVSIHGTADLIINFNEGFAYQFPPRLDLRK